MATTSETSQREVQPSAFESLLQLDRPAIVQLVSVLHLLVALFVALAYGLVGRVPDNLVLQLLALVGGMVAAGLAVLAVLDLRQRLVRRASTWVLASGLVTVAVAQLAEGLRMPWFVFFFWLVSLGGLLLGRRTASQIGVLSLAVVFLVWLFAQPQVGIIPPADATTLSDIGSLVMLIVSMLLVMFVGWRVNGELIAIQQRLGVQVAHLSQELAGLSSGQAVRASEQAYIVADAVTALQQLNASAEEISRMAGRVNRAALTDLHQTEETQAVMAETLREINEVSSLSLRVIERMHELSGMATQIGHVIGLLQGLARETQLLALNAGIEAAGAGEHGMRFAVVANEVKRLANRSLQATTEIETVLGDVQMATERVAQALGESGEAIERTTTRTSRMQTVVNELVGSVRQSAMIAEQISAATTQQLAAGDQVADLMQTVRRESAELSEQAQRLSQAARQLEQISQRLRQS